MITSSSIVQKITPGLAPDVQVIEQQQKKGAMIKVAAYCRVSTNMEIQKQSLETQIAAFQRTISEHPGWVLAGIYADRGISGTSVKHREEFLRMIDDAKAGKIQYILVKSISRFARNTVDALTYVRELKNHGVSVFFDKEKLDTGSVVSEFLLSILAASAQEEIVSLSNNVKVGRRMRSAAGIAQWVRVYGYRKGENGEWLIDEEEAAVVRRIFSEYVSGKTLPEICRGMEADGVPSVGGQEKWYPRCIAVILHNEKYIGDLLMQKSYTSDPINQIKVDNRDAKIKQYYVRNHHPAIVDKETFRMAVTMSTMKDTQRGIMQYPYYGFLKCPICGENMVRFVHARNNHAYAWTCGGKPSSKGNLRKYRTACPPYYVFGTYLDGAFWEALKALDEITLKEIVSSVDLENAELATRMLDLRRKVRWKKMSVDYRTLSEFVEQITFPQWSTMRVVWKVGVTSESEIKYKKMSDQPYPVITKELAEQDTLTEGIIPTKSCFVNGVPTCKGCSASQAESIRRAQNEIMNLVILEARSYEPPIPRVFGERNRNEICREEILEARKTKDIPKATQKNKKATTKKT